jgi:hypothetical protein
MKCCRILYATVAFWLILMTPARADWTEKFARISCIPELGVLRIEHLELDGSFFPDGGSPGEERATALKVWRKHGFYAEGHLDFSCKLAGVTYRFKSRIDQGSDHGQCGGAPAAYIDFTVDGKPLLQSLPFGDECGYPPSVRSITVLDLKRENKKTAFEVCIAPQELQDPHFRVCEYRQDGYILKDGPIDDAKMRAIYDAAHPGK